MRVTRRTFMKQGGAAVAAAGGLVPVWVQASVTVGGYQFDTLSDGNLVLRGAWFDFSPECAKSAKNVSI